MIGQCERHNVKWSGMENQGESTKARADWLELEQIEVVMYDFWYRLFDNLTVVLIVSPMSCIAA